MPSGSKTDPLLAKSESISNGGSTSVITYLQREKKKPGAKAIAAREGSETMWEKQLCRQQDQWRRRGRRFSRHQSRDFLAASGEDHGEADCPPAAQGGPLPEQVDARRRLWPHGGPTLEQAPARICGPVESGAHAQAGLLTGLVTHWGTYIGAVCSWRTAPHGKDRCWSNSWRTAARGKDSCWRSFTES